MIELVFLRDGKPCMRQKVADTSVTIGRDDDNHIQLTDEDISRKHLKIEWKEGKYVLTDFSSNGTLLNSQPIKTSEINAGDTLTIGQWTVNVLNSEPAPDQTTVSTGRAQTSVLNFDVERKALASQRIVLNIISADGKSRRTSLRQTETTFGTTDNCGVTVNDEYVSRRHCRLTHKNGRIILTDMGSTNGTYFDGIRIDHVSLPSEGSFQMGKTTIEYKLDRFAETIRPSIDSSLGPMIGNCEAMREVFALIERVASSDATVLVTGESGTGKDLVARLLHGLSHRSAKPFISVNCGSIPSSIIESQLFGHERGSFTGAVERMSGLIEQANGGTLFLDEIGEMPLELQTRLLHVIEQKKIRRLGGKEDIAVDFRLVAATNRQLQRLVANGRFREDLFYRLFVVPIHLPALRERGDDVNLLAQNFAKELSPSGMKITLEEKAVSKFASHKWPGNVRELKNVIQRAILFASGGAIKAADISFASIEIEAPGEHNLETKERNSILNALKANDGNQTKAAEILGIARTTLSTKVLKYGIDVKKCRSE
jgi:DNA-binding NtrC family response regulator